MARSDKTHEDRICELEVELANVQTLLDRWIRPSIVRSLNDAPPRTIWQRLNDWLSK